MSETEEQQQGGGKQPIINVSNVITNTNQQQQQQQQEEGGKRPSEPKKSVTTMSLPLETAIASVVGAAIGVGSALLFLPKQYSLPLALGAAIAVPKKNKGFSTALIVVLSWLIMFTIFHQP